MSNDILGISKENFRVAYRAIRVEARYTSDCIKIANRYNRRSGEPVLSGEGLRLNDTFGSRTASLCSPALYRAVERAFNARLMGDPLRKQGRLKKYIRLKRQAGPRTKTFGEMAHDAVA